MSTLCKKLVTINSVGLLRINEFGISTILRCQTDTLQYNFGVGHYDSDLQYDFRRFEFIRTQCKYQP